MIFEELKPGKSVYEKEIPAFKSHIKSKKYIYLIGGTHGDEVEGVYVLDQLINWLKEETELDDLPMVVVPILNVDGHEAGTRVNSHAVDLNRNLPSSCWQEDFEEAKYHPGSKPLSEPENVYLTKLFDKYPPGFIISFHSWKPLINFNGECEDVAEFLSRYNNYETCKEIGYHTPGSLGSYAPEKLNCDVVTFECPPITEELTLKKIWEENEEAFKELFRSDLLQKRIK